MKLLQRKKVAFFASSKTASLSVLPTLDWATEIARREDMTVCSGFQSPLEKRILPYLLRGRCGIIIALSRGIYKQIPEQYQEAYKADRILFVSQQKKTVKRRGKIGGDQRNRYLAAIADELVFASVSPESSLYKLLKETTKTITIL
ncbi:MAG: hypothetical protein NC095_11795 [Muribaculum sp.]|nr:hypothetical protein [Muribaculum sp.]